MKTSNSVPIAKISILYEDEILVVADKPAGLPTQATLDKNRPHVYGLLQEQLKTKDDKSYLALHHRLDKDTSGVLLFCKDPRFNLAISEMFKTHQFEKIYWALSEPAKLPYKGEDFWKVKSYLAEKPGPRSQRVRLHSVRSGGLAAETDFKLLEKHPKGFWIEARPKTGRMHQIRVHLAESGLPILGDDLYNPQQRPQIPRMMLHAHQLVFRHPQNQEPMTITSPAPEDFLRVLQKL